MYASCSISQHADAIRVEIAQMEARDAALRQQLAYLNSKAFLAVKPLAEQWLELFFGP